MSDWRTHVRALQRLHPDCFRAALEELMLSGGPPAIRALRAVVAALPDGEKVNLFSSIVNARTMADLVLCLSEPGALQHVQSAALIGLYDVLVGIAAEHGRSPLLRAMARHAPMLEVGAAQEGMEREQWWGRRAGLGLVPQTACSCGAPAGAVAHLPHCQVSRLRDEWRRIYPEFGPLPPDLRVRPDARYTPESPPPPQFRPDAYGYRSMHDPEAIHASAGAGVACGLPPERGVVVAELLEGVTCSPCRVLAAHATIVAVHADAACPVCGGSGFYRPDRTTCYCIRGVGPDGR